MKLNRFRILLAALVFSFSSGWAAQTAPSPDPVASPVVPDTTKATPQPAPSPSSAPAKSSGKIDFDHIEERTVFFSGAPEFKPLKTGIYDLTYLGPLRGPTSYFLFSGKSCQDCLEDRVIYALKPSGGKPTGFVYPGKIFEPKTRALVLESRAFFGKCLPKKEDIYVVYQKEKIDRRSKLQSSVFVAEPGKSFIRETLVERHLPNIQTTLALVKRKMCKEIEGRNRLMLTKPLDLHPHTNSDAEEDDDRDSETDSENS